MVVFPAWAPACHITLDHAALRFSLVTLPPSGSHVPCFFIDHPEAGNTNRTMVSAGFKGRIRHRTGGAGLTARGDATWQAKNRVFSFLDCRCMCPINID